MKRIIAFMLMAMMIFTGCKPAGETPYPDKQITMVVPWAVGGGTDITARVFAKALEQELGQKIVVVNKTGASGATGTDAVATAKADGYTLLFSADTIATMQVMGLSQLGVEDFTPIMMVSHDPKIITVAGNSAYTTIQELMEVAKANPGKINLAYSGPGASGHIQALLFKKAGAEFNMTPLGGGTAQMLSVISGQSDVTNPAGSTVGEYLETGELVNLAIFDKEEVAGYEGIPPVTNALPELASFMPATFPVSVMVKAGTDQEIVTRLTEACEKAAESEEWKTFVAEGKLEDLTHIKGNEATAYLNRLASIYSWLLFDEGVAVFSPDEFEIPRYEE